MRILNRAEMRAAEDAAAAAGTSHRQLMDNAGTAAAREILGLQPAEGSALLLCGKGNNAGDAFVIARLLAAENWRVEVALLCGEALSPLAEENFKKLPDTVKILPAAVPDIWAAVVVDGVFGTGFRGALPQAVASVFHRANRADALRVALDIPSGLDCDTGEAAPDTFEAALTLTFGAYKPGLLAPEGKPVCGEVRCLDIGL